MLSLQTKLAQTQKLLPQQVQYQKLLQLNTLALEQRIKTELEMNPVLEEVIDEEMEMSLDQLEDSNEDEYDEAENDGADDEFDLEDFINEGDLEFARINRSNDDDTSAPISPARSTLSENLIDQLHYTDLSEEEMILGENVIGSLSNDGYFKEDPDEFLKEISEQEGINFTKEQLEKVLKTIQRLDPPGIGSRNLQECLLVQLEESTYDPYYKFIAEKILQEEFKNFTNKRFDLIKKNLNITDDALKNALEIIQKLNPKPGEGNIRDEQANQITPDFIIEKVDGNYIITLNDKAMPSVTISPQYLEMLDKTKGRRKKTERERE